MNEQNHVIHKDGQVSTDKVDNAMMHSKNTWVSELRWENPLD